MCRPRKCGVEKRRTGTFLGLLLLKNMGDIFGEENEMCRATHLAYSFLDERNRMSKSGEKWRDVSGDTYRFISDE